MLTDETGRLSWPPLPQSSVPVILVMMTRSTYFFPDLEHVYEEVDKFFFKSSELAKNSDKQLRRHRRAPCGSCDRK